MKMKVYALLLALAASGSGYAAVDLTPVTSEFVLAGIKSTILTFKDNGRAVSYAQPRGWAVAWGGPRIKFTPPNIPQAQGEIEQSPLQAPQPLTDETRKALVQQTIASLPPDSQDVAVVSDEANPLLVSGHETHGVTVSYVAFGQHFVTSVLYVNTADTQLRFRATARKADFEKVHAEFRGSIYSWQWK